MAGELFEMLIIFDGNKYNADAQGTVDAVHQVIAKHKGELVVSRPWDERRFTYPIKNQKKGMYYLLYFRGPGPIVPQIEADLRLSETILRYMIVNIHPKLHEQMITIAKDEHAAVALHAPGLAEEDILGMTGGR
ncbi:MAG: 30S ribosomal protein S6 [Gemmatales bacterium]